MSATANDVSRSTRQGRRGAPSTPSQGPEGSDLRTVARSVEGLLDDDGQYNDNPGRLSRGHPDYNEADDPRAGGRADRDENGRFKAKTTPPDDAGEADDDQDIAQEIDDEVADDVSDEDADEGDADEELADSAVDETDDDEEGTEGINTLAQMAEALEMTEEQFLAAISDTFTAAGENVTVTLSELRAGYQKDADYRRNTAKLADEKRTHEQEYSQQMEYFTAHSQQMAAQMAAMEQVIVSQLESPAMRELRQRDPAEWTARREELGQQVRFVHQQRQQAAEQYNRTQTEYLQGMKQRSMQALQAAIPDFGSKHGDTARQVMSGLGYDQQEISKIFDHRLVLGALELHKLREENTALKAEKDKAITAAKRVKQTVPHFTKPGKGRSGNKAGVKRDKLARLQGNLKKSGNMRDAAMVIEQLI